MPTNDLKKAIEKKRDPEGYILRELETLQANAETLLGQVQGVLDLVHTEARKINQEYIIDQVASKFRQPEDGESPELDAIVSAVLLKLPPAENGKTPTEEELIALIEPLIPPAKEGEPGASVLIEEVIEAIKPFIPDPIPGSPDTGQEIAAKLNTTSESVDMGVIKGLSKLLVAIRTSIRESKKGSGPGGGGMGNIINQSFNVSSATTTITLSNPVAVGGNALWAYYEGALIVKGTGFTMGNDRKTVTLLFTPEDGTHIDVLFVRG